MRARRGPFATAIFAVCICLAGPALASTAAASAAAPQSGFWWLPEPIAGLIPVPGVPAGGLYIASAPTGAQAESAVRIPLAAGADRVTLTLHVSALTKLNAPAVVGYPATGDWPTGGPQPWSARPAYRTISSPAVGVFDAGDKTMSISFPASEATAGIVLVPGTAAGHGSPTFTVSFAPPTAADITVTGAVTSPPPSPPSGPKTHRPTHSPAASQPPSASSSPSPSAAASASPRRTPSQRPRPSASRTHGHSSSPQPITTLPTARSSSAASGHGTRDILIVVCVAVIAAAASLLVWRRRQRG